MPLWDGEMASAPSRWRSWAFDSLIAFFLIFVSITILISVLQARNLDNVPLGIALLVLHSGSVLFRRKAPLTVMVVNVATGLAVYALGFPVVVLGVATLVALYTVASRCDRVRSLSALGLLTVAMATAVATERTPGDASTIVANAIVFVVVWFLGDSQRSRRTYVTQLEERTAELERARDELARRAVSEERLRIARELHDIVAHSMGLIAVQAGVGAHVIHERPDEAKRSLTTIENASRSALGEIRRMLGLLRSNGDGAQTAPSPGLDHLPGLAEEVSGAGVDVELRVEPPPKPLPVGAELTIFRVVQEVLTNVLKHARARRARVSVWFVDGVGRIEVVDDGAAVPGDSKGHGIIGMRERVAMHGARFSRPELVIEGGSLYGIPVGQDVVVFVEP
jgi:signal transduction histidine kinase